MKKYYGAEDIKLVYSGNNYFDVLEEIIDKSCETLHLQTYIFAADETGSRVTEALKRAAARGVKVYLLVDAFGSFPFSKTLLQDILSSGIRFRLFSPFFSSESVFLWRRLHHKIIVADKKLAMTGGINIANKYNKNTEGDPWLDYAVLIKGDVCEYLHLLCEQFFHKKSGRILRNWIKNVTITDTEKNPHLVRFRRNDWVKGNNEIHNTYVESIVRSESSLTIVASYFLPGKNFRTLLSKAAARGVKIRVIMAGRSDISSVRLAENYLYDFYIRNNIELYEWTNSMMHGKAMIVDNTWATIGSYNFNLLSHYLSIELNADIIDKNFVEGFAAHLNTVISTSSSFKEITKHEKSKSIFRQFKMWVAYNVYRIIMFIIMAKRKHSRKRKN
jgi:cardiolipin synthase